MTNASFKRVGSGDLGESTRQPSTAVAPTSFQSALGAGKESHVTAPVEVAALPAAANGLFDGPWYYPARYLHRHVTVLHPIEPTVPPGAGDLRGRVAMVLRVNPKGAVDGYEILDSEPLGFFEKSVIEAFAYEQYAPGLIAGTPVRGQLHVEVVFEPGEVPKAVLNFGISRQP